MQREVIKENKELSSLSELFTYFANPVNFKTLCKVVLNGNY